METVESTGRITFKIADPVEGDVRKSWDKGKPAEVEDAEATFEHLTKDKGYAAFKVGSRGKKDEQIRSFDPMLEQLVFVPQMAGG